MMKKNMMKRNVVFVLSLILGSIVSLPAEAVMLTPSNVVIPTLSGETFSFDLIIDSDPAGYLAMGYQSLISVSGPGGLSLDVATSEAVAIDAGYWIVGNSAGTGAIDQGGDNYVFGDGPSNPGTEILLAGDIMARYAFTWDGSVGDYTFTLDPDTAKSFILNGTTFGKDPLEFTSGQYPGDDTSFTVQLIPEPASIMLLVFGAGLLRKPKSIKNRKV